MADRTAQFRQAQALFHAGKRKESAALWRDLAETQPDDPDAWNNLGVTLSHLGSQAEAEAALRIGIGLRPLAGAFRQNLGLSLHIAGRLSEAVACYRDALALSNDREIRHKLAYALLALGEWEEGWRQYEFRREAPWFDDHRADPRLWAGEPVNGRDILVWPEQGFGDIIQFTRFIPILVARGARVTLVAYPPLFPLLRELPVTVLDWDKVDVLPPYDYWTNVMSIPLGLGLTLGDLTGEPYLTAPPERRERWAGHAGKGAIGYAWRGRPTHDNDRNRSLQSPDALMETLGRTGAPLVDLTDPLGDFADLAAVIEQLDLVVTVDTAVAHLAGALGVPCWVLLPHNPDWRWMLNRDDSPWYDNTRLFRQPQPGDWDAVMADLARALKKRKR